MATKGSTERALAEIEAEDLRRRLALLEADMASSRRERVTIEQLEAEYCVNGSRDAGPAPVKGSFTWKIQEAQRKARERNRRASERQAAEHEAQLAKAQPEVDQLQAQIGELGQRVADIQRKADAEMAKLNADIRKARNRIDELQRLPELKPERNPDAIEMLPYTRDLSGRMQYAPRRVVEALHAAKRRGLSHPDAMRHLIDTGVVDASDFGMHPTAGAAG